MSANDTYKSIAEQSEGLFKDNGSRFIARAYPVESETEVKEIVSALRKEYFDARHHCYAYRLGLDGTTWRASDDGEPSASAGLPILGQIDSAGLSDVLVVVILQDQHGRRARRRARHREGGRPLVHPAFPLRQPARRDEGGQGPRTPAAGPVVPRGLFPRGACAPFARARLFGAYRKNRYLYRLK